MLEIIEERHLQVLDGRLGPLRFHQNPGDQIKVGTHPFQVVALEFHGSRFFKSCRSRNVTVQEKLPVVVVADIVDFNNRLGRGDEHMSGKQLIPPHIGRIHGPPLPDK